MVLGIVKRILGFRSQYGEICFQRICYLHNNKYVVPSLRCITSQTFCNAIMHSDPFADKCIEKYMGKDIIWKVPKVANWKGLIEGRVFVYHWLSIVFNMQIHIWCYKTRSIKTRITHSKHKAKIFTYLKLKMEHVFNMNH